MTDTSTKRFAVVTGASSGIGYELAAEFARNGFDLLIASETDKITDAATRLASAGTEVDSIRVDLATYDGVEALYGRIRSGGRPVDAIAINAGVGVSGDFARGTDLRDELNLINLNVISPVHLAKRVLPDMVARGEGRVLFTSSIAATMPGSFAAIYNASKAFVKSFAEAIRNELKDTGVTVTTLMPGPTETEFFDRAGLTENDTKLGQKDNKDDPAQVAKEGYEALMAGKDHIVAGSFMNKLQSVAGHILPDTVMAEMHRKQAEPGSARK
ncbi:MAG TPA: SDR family NAD(P)-dependent oxidoreductase [Bryobacteraceae bacterium]|nr:SDR family NAD(P)-dependent oxidoreductase [Bryobacteraceae bacterium]